MFSTCRRPLESAPGPWRLRSHQAALLSLLIATSESQESCTEWRARRAAQCLWSGVHLGTGQVGRTNTPPSVLGIRAARSCFHCADPPQSWSVGSWRPHPRGGAQGCGGPLGDAHELRGGRRLALCLHQRQVTFTRGETLATESLRAVCTRRKRKSLILSDLQMEVTCMYGVGMKVVSWGFHQGLSGSHRNSSNALKQVGRNKCVKIKSPLE